jgi:hypothetical protein
MSLITEEMRTKQKALHEKLVRENKEAAFVETWWDCDSLFTPNPKLCSRVIEAKLKEKNT